jgi:intraflagellar transport protein 80
VIDRTTGTTIHLLDVASGKPVGSPLKHELEIVEVALSAGPLGNVATGADRKLVFIDRNRDLWLANLASASSSRAGGAGSAQAPPFKLATQVDTAAWNEGTDILAAIVDGKMVFWYYPAVVHIDRDLVPLTKSDSVHGAGGAGGIGLGGAAQGAGDAAGGAGNFGKSAVITSFVDTRVLVRRADGSVQSASMSPYPALMYKFASENSWTRCTRLARFVAREEGKVLWAMLACMALQAAQLDTAEVALASIEAVDKLQYIQSVKLIPSAEGRQAELALYRRQVVQAEEILLAADLVWRAIKMHISLFHWTRALELALKHKTHIDTVCAYRAKFLQSLPPDRRAETEPQFLKVNASLPPNALTDWDTINGKIEAEARREEARGTPYRTSMPLMNDEDPLARLAQQQHQQQRQPHNAGGSGAGGDVVGL